MNDEVVNPFSKHFADIATRQSARQSVDLLADPTTPDDTAEALRIGRTLGIPAQAVAAEPEQYRGLFRQDQVTRALASAPRTADWFAKSLTNSNLGKDEVEHLGGFEALGNAIRRGYVSRIKTLPASRTAMNASTRIADYGLSYDEILNDETNKQLNLRGVTDIANAPSGLVSQVSELAETRAQERFSAVSQMSDDDIAATTSAGVAAFERLSELRADANAIASSGRSNAVQQRLAALPTDGVSNWDQAKAAMGAIFEDPLDGAAFLLETSAESLPAMLPAIATVAVTKSPASGVAVMGGSTYLTESSVGAMDFLDQKGIQISSSEDALALLQDQELLQEAREYGHARGMVIGLFAIASGGLASQTLSRNTAVNLLGQSVGQAGLGTSGEAAAQIASTGEIESPRDIVIEGLAELPGAVPEAVIFGGQSLQARIGQAEDAGRTAASIDEIDKMVADSKLRTRSPEAFSDFLASVGLDETELFVSAEGVQEYFQAKDMVFDEEMMRAWGVDPEDFAQKLVSGGDIAVPVSEYASNISGSVDAEWLKQNATTSPDEMSLSDAAKFNAEVQDIMEQAKKDAEAMRLEDDAMRADDVQIYDSMVSQLRSAGQSPDVAANQAMVWTAFWRSMGERYGSPPLDLARSMGVRVQGVLSDSDEQRRRGDLDIKLNTLRSQGEKALSPTGQSILQFVRDQGGVRDIGGDVESLDVPKGVIAETRDQYNERTAQPSLTGVDMSGLGRGLDELGRAAIEAGYFPDLMGGADITADGTIIDEAAILLEAIQREVSGEPTFIQGEGPDADLSELMAELSARGIDLSMSNDEIAAALMADADAGVEYNQDGELITDSAAFRAWAGTDEIIDGDEVNYESFDGQGPWVMRLFHGTTHDFEAFDASVGGQKGGQFGAVNYFTSSEADATGNYGADGPDLTNRIEMRAEQLIDELEGSTDQDVVEEGVIAAANARARAEIVGGEPRLLEVYVRTEKPFIVGSDDSPFLEFTDFEALEEQAIIRVSEEHDIDVDDVRDNIDDYQDEIDVARWEIEAEEGNALTEAVMQVAARYDLDAQQILSDLAEIANEGAQHSVFEETLREAESLMYADDPETGDMIGYHVLGEIIEALGFDSIILKNADDRFSSMDMDEGTAHVHVFDSHNTNIKSVENRGTFDASDPRILYQDNGDKRGSIVLPSGGVMNGESVINLFEKANLSTFLHESGHFFLEAFTALATSEGAPQAMVDDLAVIHKFLGVEEGATLTVDQHETWARGFEQYLMEGKSPSLELMSAFTRFKAWLTRIYKSAVGLNVKINPEIRGVMDRMLATDKEIAEMRADLGMRPLFSEKPAGMSQADFATYQRMARRGVEQAEASLMKRTMAKVRRETEAWFKTEKKAVTAEVTAMMNTRPAYRLVELLGNGKWLGDADQDAPDIRIDKAALVDRFGVGVLQELNRSKLGGKRAIYADGGETPESVADMFGFASVTDMVETLQNSGKRSDAIAAETDRIMTERHGDPLNDGSIEEAAAVAVHSEQQAAAVASEIRALGNQLGRNTRDNKAKIYAARAKAMISGMSVRQASRPNQFLMAERKAARAAETAFAKVTRGGTNSEAALAQAMSAKEQQLLNQYLYREAQEFTTKLKSDRERMMRYNKKTVREKLDGGYIEQIDALLSDYDFRVKSQGQINRAESLKAYVDRMIADGRESELSIDPRLMDEASRRHYTRLTVDELRGLFDTIANIDHMGRYKKQLAERARKRDLAETVSHVTSALRSSLKVRDSDGMQSGLKALNLLSKPDTIMIRLDGGDEMGVIYDNLKRGIDESAALEQAMQVDMATRFDALFSEHYSRDDLKAMQNVVPVKGMKYEWTRQEVIALALNVGNADGFQRATDQKVHISRRLTEGDVKKLLATLSQDDWKFVQGLWDMVNSYWPDLAAVHKRRTGVEPAKVEAQMMYDGAPSFVTGGYYPIKYDPTKGKAAARDEKTAWDQFATAGHGSTAAVKNGMTKAREKSGGGRTLMYDLNVPLTHMRETMRFIAMSEAVDATYRIINDDTVIAAFQDTGNIDTLDTLNLWLKDVARGPVFNTDLLNTMARVVKNNFTISKLAFNMKTVILQATGLGQSAAVIGKKNMIRGMVAYAKDMKQAVADVTAMSPFMAERSSTFQKDIYDFINDTSNASPLVTGWRAFKNDAAKWGFAPLVKMQFFVVDMPTWMGAYDAELQRNGGDQKKAAHFADRMVVRAQDSAVMSDRSGVERGTVSDNVRQADFIRIFTTLGGYMLTKANRVAVTSIQGKQAVSEAEGAAAKTAAAISAATDLTLLLAFEAAFMGLIWDLLDDDDEEGEMQAFMLKEVGAAMVGGIPIVRDAYSAFQGYGGGGVYGSVLEVPANVYKQAVQGENDKGLRRALGEVVGLMTGLPTTATLRGIEAAIDEDTSIVEGVLGNNPLSR